MEEIEKLIKLRDEWLSYSPSEENAVNLLSDIGDFRNNTHINFPDTNSFYYNGGEYIDVFFGDAIDAVNEYLESKNEIFFNSTLKNISEGFNEIIKKLELKRNF